MEVMSGIFEARTEPVAAYDSEERRLADLAAKGDLDGIRQALKQGADPCWQDEEGVNALMKAAEHGRHEIVQLLLETGVPWNAIDRHGRCAGDYALSAGHKKSIMLLVDAGCRAELLLGAVERMHQQKPSGKTNDRTQSGKSSKSSGKTSESQGCDGTTSASSPRTDQGSSEVPEHAYLQQRAQYERDGERLMDEGGGAVMMAWEGPLMEAHAQAVCSSGGDVLNVGFGLGLVDQAIQQRNPRSHTIVEAHPDVYARMLRDGWHERPGVRILYGRWQDVLPQLGQYDGIFWDTYGEYYEEMREFHTHLPSLLRRGGIYSYFNGLAADNAFFHLVYCHLVQRELARLGLYTQFIPLPINVSDPAIWEGIRNRYWQLDTYYLPVSEWDDEEVVPEELEEEEQSSKRDGVEEYPQENEHQPKNQD
eukprot:jgi/Botrbrau1/4938/Bobra.0122s0020.1